MEYRIEYDYWGWQWVILKKTDFKIFGKKLFSYWKIHQYFYQYHEAEEYYILITNIEEHRHLL